MISCCYIPIVILSTERLSITVRLLDLQLNSHPGKAKLSVGVHTPSPYNPDFRRLKFSFILSRFFHNASIVRYACSGYATCDVLLDVRVGLTGRAGLHFFKLQLVRWKSVGITQRFVATRASAASGRPRPFTRL